MTTVACDASVLIPALVAWHPDHAVAREAMARVTAVPAHALVEAFSVLTRLPAPHRLSAPDAGRVLDHVRLDVDALPATQYRRLLRRLAERDIRGGAAYYALIAATATHHRRTLITLDRRAGATYDAVGAGYTML